MGGQNYEDRRIPIELLVEMYVVLGERTLSGSEMSREHKADVGFQFSFRAILCITTFWAIIAWLWPRKMDIVPESALLIALAVSMSAAFVLAESARRILRCRVERHCGGCWREQFALYAGIVGTVPYGAVILFGFLDQFESTYRGVHTAMMVSWGIAVYVCLPAIILLIISLVLFFEYQKNSSLLWMRILGLAVNLVWPVVVVYGILPKLG